MIAGIVTDPKTGEPIDGNGKKLSKSAYNPIQEIQKLFARVQADYIVNYGLQNRPFNEFDGYSLLQRDRMDTKTFGAFVGAQQMPTNQQWRWQGRKNTARNKVIGILAHMLSGMLFPYCYAYNENNEEDKMTAKVMRILIENHLRKADYEIKFLFIVTSALVHPAVFVEIEYVEAIQTVKQKLKDGTIKIIEAVDEILSGLNLNIVPIDSILLGDFFTFDLQRQPNICRVRRISYDEARNIYKGKHIVDGVDQFDYVTAGMTRVVIAGQDNQTLYDIDWTEADGNFVQEITMYYRGEDLQVTFVGGVFMGEEKDVYNSNPFKHRRISMINDEWISIPIYPFAKTGFEPLDPHGRFAYYKSACFKEFWDDASQNKAYQLAQDGMYLDVIKPVFMSGVAKIDQTVMVPGATIGMPQGATVTPYQMSPNLSAALEIMRTNKDDMSESTQDQIMSGITQKGVTAYATSKAEQNAKVILGVFGVLIADLVRQIGELTIDCVLRHTTVGEVDAAMGGDFNLKYKKVLARGKEGGKDVTNRIEFDPNMMGDSMTKEQADELEWKMFEDAGGMESDQRIYKVNPYKFARYQFSLYIDPDMIISRAMGTDQLRKERAFSILTDQRVAQFIDQEAVVDKFVLEEFSDGDPDQFKKKPEEISNEMLNQVMGAPSEAPMLPNKQPMR